MAEKMSTVGWQGITFKVPPDWSLVGVSGDEKKGYFRVDSPIASALEVRWSAALGKAPELMAKAREFISTMEKSCKKSKLKFSSKLKQEGPDKVSFSWRSDRRGQGRLMHCAKCDRVVIAQVISSDDENVTHIVPNILGSLSDHRDDGRVAWGLYGLEFTVPEGYRIEKQSLMSGYLSLTFKDRASTLVVDRWGLPDTLLNGDSLEEWYKKDVMPDIKGYRLTFEETELSGHEGMKVTGRRAGIKQALKAAASSLTLHEHPGLLTGYVWHCRESNRLFSVRATHTEDEDVAESVRDSIACHHGVDKAWFPR